MFNPQCINQQRLLGRIIKLRGNHILRGKKIIYKKSRHHFCLNYAHPVFTIPSKLLQLFTDSSCYISDETF